MSQCQATTQKGTQCGFKTINGSFCKKHTPTASTSTTTDIDSFSDDIFINKTKADQYEQEIMSFMTCVKGNAPRLQALCEIMGLDGGYMEDCCVVIDKELKNRVMRDIMMYILIGDIPRYNDKMKNNYLKWNVGCFGSRWFDVDAKKYGLDYIRVAFYSKKNNPTAFEEFETDKPYAITITMEKSR